MTLKTALERIQELMAKFVAEVECSAALSLTDINIISENVVRPILTLVYGYTHLRNLNATESSNFPSIDLADDKAGVAIQISADNSSEKIKETLQKFIDHKLFEKYHHLRFYFLKRKQNKYSIKDLKAIIDGKFNFDLQNDVLDHTDILKITKGYELNGALRLLSLLEGNVGRIRLNPQSVTIYQGHEDGYLNLIPITFPDTLYLGHLDIPPKEPTKKPKWNRTNEREIALAMLKSRGLRFACDWECHENQIVTFHNLDDNFLPLSEIVDKGTITQISPIEYYTADENYERVFKSLLRRSLQQYFFQLGISWQNTENIFIFCPLDDSDIRKIAWSGDSNGRKVFERTWNNVNPEKVLNCKHLAFSVRFLIFNQIWYLAIKPDWFFSYDGYKPSFYSSNNITWLKRNEKNPQVYNHFRFIAEFIKGSGQTSLFPKDIPSCFIKFGDIVKIDLSPPINDNEWLPLEDQLLNDSFSGQTEMEFGR